MALKSALQALINGRTDGGGNLISTERTLWGFIRDELYPTKVSDTHSTTNVLTKVYADIEYTINFKKVGNTVFVWGSVENVGASINGGTNLANITNSVYIPDSFQDFFFQATRINGSSSILLHFTYGSPNGNLFTRSTIPTTNVKYYFNTSYTVAS